MDPLRVVIADDDQHMREALADLIDMAAGLQLVAVARDAEEAVATCRRHQPDVAVLDINMPGGGHVAAAGIRSASPSTRMIALSSDRSDAARRQMLEAGVVEVLVKGVPVERLLSAVRGPQGEPGPG